MRYILLFFICIIFSHASVGQDKSSKEKKWTESESKQLDKAELLFAENNFRLALPIFEKLLSNHPSDPRLKYAYSVCGLTSPGKQAICLQLLKEVYEKNKKASDIDYYLAKANFLNYNFDEALSGIAKYSAKLKKPKPEQLKNIEDLTRYCNNAKALMANPIAVKIDNMGAPLNTEAAESTPNLTDDENTIIFTYRGMKSKGGLQNAFNQPNKDGVYYEDVYISTKENGVWKTPEELKKINTNNNEAALFLSNDGQKLFVNMDSQQDDGDIYVSALDSNGWSSPVKLRGDVNTTAWENNTSLSPDGKTLFFASSRPGGFGGKDIYKSSLLPDGTWGKAINLGDKINTPYDEDAPFIHYDGRLLLFSSRGHNSMGGYDIFKTYLNISDSSWSVPENIGYPINTPLDDDHYVLSPSGEAGYYSLGKTDGFGDLDMYKVEPGITGIMPVVAVVKGTTTIDNKPVQADIVVEVANTVFRSIHSDSKTGLYRMTLPVGNDYKITWKLNNLPIQTKTIEASKASAYLLEVHDVNFTSLPDTTQTIVADNSYHTGNEHIDGLVYKIQISAGFLNEKIKRRKARKLGGVDKETIDGVDRFTLKQEFLTYNEATAKIKEVRELIISDAFIIGIYKGKRCYLSDLRTQGILKIK